MPYYDDDIDFLSEFVAPTPTVDTLSVYLHEIGEIPLLTASEEIELAEHMERGIAAQARLNGNLHPQLRAALTADVERATAARRHLTQANLRLVVSIAKKYVGRGMNLMDLIQEGNIGLMRAVEKFDHHKGNRFSTYATWWIRQAVTRSIAEQGRTIRLPVHMSETVMRVKHTVLRLSQELGRAPTTEDIADALGQSVAWAERVLEVSRRPVSLHLPIGDEGNDHELGDFLPDAMPLPDDQAVTQSLRADVRASLELLDDRERIIVAMRFGLVDGERRTLEEVGKVIGTTRERARQIEAEAFRKLRKCAPSLRSYIVDSEDTAVDVQQLPLLEAA